MAPWRGDRPTERLEVDPGGEEVQIGDAVLGGGATGEAGRRADVLGGEPNREHLELKVPPERRVVGAAGGSWSVGEELWRPRDERRRGLRLSSRSLRVRMWWDLGGAVPGGPKGRWLYCQAFYLARKFKNTSQGTKYYTYD